jgi:GNAT superfamily N-acetyltransferase
MSKEYEIVEDEYLISTDKTKLSVEAIHNFLSKESYWAENIPLHIVQTAIDNSLCFGLYHSNKQTLPTGRQVGFARLITDKATFAYLADVFIINDYRGKGLSKWLIKIIHEHPELQMLRGWLLRTKDAHGLYEQFGWQRASEEQMKKIMTRYVENIYKK